MRTRLFILMLIFCLQASAQDAEFYPILAVKLSPLSALDPLTSTFALSASLRPAPRLGLHFEYGWQYESLKLIDRHSALANSRYYELRPEIRYFVAYGGERELYLTLEGFYIPHHFSRERSYIVVNGRDIRYDAADGNRLTYGVALKGGVQFIIEGRLLLEVFSGFGYRRREINIFNLINPREDFVHDHSLGVDPFTRPGVKHRLHLAFGLRLGGVLARRRLKRQ